MSFIRPALIAAFMFAILPGCASNQVVVSGNQAMEHCARIGKDAKLDNTNCPAKNHCVTTFVCIDK